MSSGNILKFEVIVEHQLNGVWCVEGNFGQGFHLTGNAVASQCGVIACGEMSAN